MKRLAVFLFLCFILIAVLACDLPGTTVTTTTTTIAIEDIDDWVDVDTLTELLAVKKTDHVRLVGDIDFANAEWTPLGNQKEPFSGIFNGNGHTISNVRITTKHDDFVGFFGVLTGTVFDFTLANVTIDYQTDFLTYAGLLAGYVSGDLSNIAASGSIRVLSSQSNVFAGGLAGFITSKVAQSTTATQFQATVLESIVVDVSIQIDAKNYVFVGGLAGKTYNVSILGATIDAQIEAANDRYRIYAGGLSGHNYSGLLKGFEHVLDSTDIVHEDLLVKATIQIIALKGAVGGLYGHDSYGVIRRAAASLTVHFGGEPLIAGGLAGESWNGSYHQSAASLVFGTAVIDHTAYEWGPLLGSTWGTILASSSVYCLNTTLTPTTSFGNEVPLASLQSPDYFEIDLSWGESERLQAAASLFQP